MFASYLCRKRTYGARTKVRPGISARAIKLGT